MRHMKNTFKIIILLLLHHSSWMYAQQLEWTALANPDSLQVNSVHYSNDDLKVISATNCHPAHIRMFRSSDGVNTWDYLVPDNLMCQMGTGFSSDGKYLASIEEMGHIILFDYTPAVPDSINTLVMGTQYAFAIAFAPNSQKLVAGGSNGKMQTFNINTASIDLNITAHSSWVTAVNYSPDNTMIASGGNDNLVKLWDTTGNALLTLPGHADDITGLQFSPDNSRLYSSSADNSVKVWNTVTGALIHSIPVSNSDVNAIDLSNNGHILGIASKDNWIRLYNTATWSIIDSFLQDHGTTPQSIDLSSDGSKLVTGTVNGLVTQYQIGALTGIKTSENTDLQGPFLYPNPTTEYLYCSRNEKLKQVRLFDFSGRMITALKVAHNAIILPYDLPKGTYLISVLTEESKLNSQLIYKQ